MASQTNTINLNTYKAKILSNTFGANNSPVYFDDGVPTILTTIGGQYEPVWVNNGVITAITAGTTAQFYRGDKSWSNTLTGILTLYREGTSTNNYASGITFSNKDTTTGKTESGMLYLYNSHNANGYGAHFYMNSNSSIIIAAGENGSTMQSTYASTGDNTAEHIYLTADSSIYLESNANTTTNRLGLQIDTDGALVPVKAESANNGIQNIGADANRWKAGYFTTSLCVSAAPATGVTSMTAYNSNALGTFIGPGIVSAGTKTQDANGIYLMGNGAQYGRFYVRTFGTANSGTDNATRGTQGLAYLMIGNRVARPAAGTAGGADNARGILYLYHTDTTATTVYSDSWNGHNLTVVGSTNSTANSTGSSYIILGNSTKKSAASASSTGYVRIYGDEDKYHDIYPGNPTANRIHYLPNATGWIVTGGNGTSTGAGDSDTPVYLKTDGTLAAITSYDGNAATATKLQTARNLTIGATAKSFDGTTARSWTMDEIMGASDSTKFYRGDKTWSNTLANDLYLSGAKALYINSTGAIAHNGTNLWIGATATNSNVFVGNLYLNGGLDSNGKRNRVIYVSLGANADATTGTNYPIVHKDATGSSTKGIYLDSNGKTIAMSYSLSATVNAATTANTLAYYSDTTTISSYPRIRNIGSARYPIDINLYNDAGNLVGEMWYDVGNATNVTKGQWFFLSESPNSTNNTGTTGKYEYFYLPNVNTGRTENASYAIRTSKDNNYTVSNATTAASCSGNAATATALANTASDVSAGGAVTGALQAFWNANKTTLVRNKLIAFTSSHSGRALHMGYFINGYDNNPYGGFFTAFYGTPYYSYASNGSFGCSELVRNNGGSYGISVTGSAGSVAWADVSGKPDQATRWAKWNEIGDGADSLSEGTSNWTDNTEILTSYASNNGFADTNAKGKVYRRDAIYCYNYIKSKASGSWGISVTGSAATLAPTGVAGFTTDEHGNFKHKRNTNTDNWQIQNSGGTAKFQFYWETGNVTLNGITISNTTGTEHISFSRTGGHNSPNYLNVPASSALCISVGGAGGTNIVAMFESTGILPYSTNTKSVGSSDYKWNAMYATTFYGALSGNANTATRIKNNLSAASSNVNRNIWVSSTSDADGIPNYCSNFYYNPSSATLGIASGGRLYANGGALYLGNSNNASWTYVQDIASHSGIDKWKIVIGGTANFTACYGAVWNDYAEMRKVPEAQINIETVYDNKGNLLERSYPYAGRCVTEIGNGSMNLTNYRLQKGCKIISDTFGFCIGETDDCKTPIAVTGRVLAYPLESLEECSMHIGDFVCSGPNGTVSIMTTEEVIQYPESVVGTISEIPTYEIWHCGNKDTKPIQVNGRIWIYVR